MQLNDYAGVIHFHSAYSFDGRAAVEEIVTAARRNGVDFLMLTDHSTLAARNDGLEGYHDGVLLIVGEEIAPRFNHYLAFQIRETITSEKEPNLTPQRYIDAVREQGGMGFIAHPDHAGAALFHVKHYPWIDWSVHGYTGLGIWDFMTDWQNSLTGYLRAIGSYAFPALLLRGPSPETLARWDRLAQERSVVGIGELDNHDTLTRFMGINISIFPFKRVFRLIRTHLLTLTPLQGESREDIPLLLDAMRKGRAYISLDYFRPATGFSLTVTDGRRIATIGDDFSLQRSADLLVRVPYPARMRVITNGNLLCESVGRELATAITEPGVYRVEAELKVLGRYRPWIFSNPVYVKRP
jgi:hypothetical protein